MSKKNTFVTLLIISIFVLFGMSCSNSLDDLGLLEATDSIKEKVVYFAYEYANAKTEYEWGGNDPLYEGDGDDSSNTIKIDCSGLVVMCYKYALVHSEYELPFWDSTVKDMYNNWTTPTQNPTPGDLIFMGEVDSDTPTHIAIFEKTEGGNIHFIDSTQKDSPDDDPQIDGVSRRFYHEEDERFKSFGTMLVRNKRFP